MIQTKELLYEVSDIIKRQDEKRAEELKCGERFGSLFNIFEILCISTREVYMCKVLAELLNPKGLHCQGTKYLDLFCKLFLSKNFEIATNNVSVITEDLTKNLDEIGKENRRIDIVIDEQTRDKNGNLIGHYIPIEVKINATEQKEQCQDYLNSARKIYKARGKNENEAVLFYLTKSGSMPISINNNDKQHVRCISWYQIVDWLNECICQADTIRKVSITEIILQYKTTIERFLKGENDMSNEIIKLLTENAENLKSAEEISKNLDKAKKILWKNFTDKIVEKLNDNTYYRNADKVVYKAKSIPVEQNIAEYNAIIYEGAKIRMSKVKYENEGFDGSGYKSETDKKYIEFEKIIDNLEEQVEDCFTFLVR